MPTVQFNLRPVLRQHKTIPLALAEASGLSRTTVYNIVNNKAKAVEPETIEKLLMYKLPTPYEYPRDLSQTRPH